MNKGAPTRASSVLIVWLIAEGETPRSAAAAEKLRLSATRRKASIPSSAPWGIVKSCFKALADYRGLSKCATAPIKVAQRNERNLSHVLSALLFPPLSHRLRHRRRFGARLHRPDGIGDPRLCPVGRRLSLRRSRRTGACRRKRRRGQQAVERQAFRFDRQEAVRSGQRTRRRQAVPRRAQDRRRRRSRNRQPDGLALICCARQPTPISGTVLSLSPTDPQNWGGPRRGAAPFVSARRV